MSLESSADEEYDKRFFRGDSIKRLQEHNISAREANQYNKGFIADNIIFFKEYNISADTANKYTAKRWKLDSTIYQLVKLNCPVDVADRYPRDFSYMYILYRNDITPELAKSYMRVNKNFNEDDIVKLVKMDVAPKKISEYRKELREGILDFVIAGCEPKDANAYPEKFTRWDIVEMFKARVDPNASERYDSRFTGRDISILWKSSCSHEFANQYNKRFTSSDIATLYLSDVTPSKANQMHPKLKADTIVELTKAGLSMRHVSKYMKHFGVNTAAEFAIAKKPVEWLSRYDSRFIEYSKDMLFSNDIAPDLANKFDERFYGDDISFIVRAGCTPEKASEYNKRFSGEDIAEFFKMDASASQVNAYSERFQGDTIRRLLSAGYEPATADQYDKRFDSSGVFWLASANCAPDTANKYDKRFDGQAISELFEAGIGPKKAGAYPINSGRDIVKLIKSKKTAAQLQKYIDKLPGRFSTEVAPALVVKGISIKKAKEYMFCRDYPFCIEPLAETGCPPVLAQFGKDAYNREFDAWEVASMFRDGCMPDVAHLYDKEFRGQDIGRMYRFGCTPEIANKYYKEYYEGEVYGHDGGLIALMYATGIRPDTMNIKDQKYYGEQLAGLYLIEDLRNNPEKYKFMTTGSKGVIIIEKNTRKKNAWRLSAGIENEYDSLKEVANNNANLRNVVRVKNKVDDCAMQLEYINGDSLKEILIGQEKLSTRKVLKYSSDIMNGLIEMRNSGIQYHRDIRPANVVIDKRKDRAVIIDLEYTTKNANEHMLELDTNGKYHNRRFNGPNDISSLGQLMYYMATGTSVFADTKEHKSDLSDIADEIQKNRSSVYRDKTGQKMNKIYEKIDTTIQDDKLKYLIKHCLTAKHTDYEKIYESFKKVSA